MKLRELMDCAFDEVWFCVVTPDGEEHYFLNSDYVGWHPDVVPELEPLLDREFDEFDLVMKKDPEAEEVENAEMVPMVWVGLEKTEDEIRKDRIESRKLEAKKINESRAELDGERREYAELRMFIPYHYVILMRVKDSFCVFGEHALAYLEAYRRGYSPYTLRIPKSRVVAFSNRVFKSGHGIAIAAKPVNGTRYEIALLANSDLDLEEYLESEEGK